MASKKTKKSKFFTPFKVIFLNEESLQEEYSTQMSRFRLSLLVGIIVLVSIILGILLYKGVNQLLYSRSPSLANSKSDVIRLSEQVEKLESQLKSNEKYIENLRGVITKGSPPIELDTTRLSIEGDIENQVLSSQLRDSMEHAHTPSIIPNTTVPMVSAVPEVSPMWFSPLKGKITSHFNRNQKHFAIDIVARTGDPIKSIGDGVVVFSDWTSTTGYVIIIMHPAKTISVYKHNSTIYKKEGDRVKTGEVIAAVGNTGEFTTGPHLHFELWKNGNPVDPMEYIKF